METHIRRITEPTLAPRVLADPDVVWIEGCFDRHGAYLRRIAAAHVGISSADDMVSEAFAIAWAQRGRYSPEKGSERDWLVGILINRCRLRIRTDRRWQARGRRASEGEVAPEGDPASALVERLDALGQSHELVQRVRELPEKQRVVILLVAIGELSTTEIASALQMKHSTVRSHLRRARRAIAATYTEQEAEHAADQ